MTDATDLRRPAAASDRYRGPVSAVVSTSVHLMILLGLAVWTARTPTGIGDEQNERPVGVAIVHRQPDRTQFVIDPVRQSESTSAAAAASAPPPGAAPPIDLDGVLAALKSPTPGSGIAGDGLSRQRGTMEGTTGSGGTGKAPVGSGQDATTMVFGVSGTGSRFAYVFDRSDSMNGYGGRPLTAAKREMIKSLKSLSERQRFSLIFYNDQPVAYGASRSMSGMPAAEPVEIRSAESFIRNVRASGGTGHYAALQMALNLNPDVIFFLTDADQPRLTNTQMRRIHSRCDAAGATLHAIELGDGGGPSPTTFLRPLAEGTGGSYQYLRLSEL